MKKYNFDAVIFDMDGVVTKTARIHALAWKAAFDEYLRLREKRDNEPFREFTHEGDYLPYVDGKPRYEGVQSFLESRGINIPFGEASDPPDKETACGIGNKKQAKFMELLKTEGIEVYPSTVKFIKDLIKSGVHTGIISSSKNCQFIIQSAGVEDLFETRVDGVVSKDLGLRGKPEPDVFFTAARNMGVSHDKSVVVEDALSGVQAGRNGGFGLVLGIARKNNVTELLEGGADVVVSDLEEIDMDWVEEWFQRKPRLLVDLWDKDEKVKTGTGKPVLNSFYLQGPKSAIFSGKKPVFFLDYDGTLTPIVSRPELAVISGEMRAIVAKLSQIYTTAIVSGRMREDVMKLTGIQELIYAGSHGFDIQGPEVSMVHPEAKKLIPVISEVIEKLKAEISDIPGLLIEEKKFSVAVHYRLVDESKYLPQIRKVVQNTVKGNKSLRFMSGKKVFEILPAIDWDKGKAIRWIMQALKIDWANSSVIYIGDDTTDEDAFREVRTRGTGILVSDEPIISSADFRLTSPDEVKRLFEKIIAFSDKG